MDKLEFLNVYAKIYLPHLEGHEDKWYTDYYTTKVARYVSDGEAQYIVPDIGTYDCEGDGAMTLEVMGEKDFQGEYSLVKVTYQQAKGAI